MGLGVKDGTSGSRCVWLWINAVDTDTADDGKEEGTKDDNKSAEVEATGFSTELTELVVVVTVLEMVCEERGTNVMDMLLRGLFTVENVETDVVLGVEVVIRSPDLAVEFDVQGNVGGTAGKKETMQT